MKKKELKKKLEVATKALELYREYMIDGKLYAAEALDTMNWIHSKEVEKIVNDTLKRNLNL